jgi:uncharacterized cupredoxin-like copper-binding protein
MRRIAVSVVGAWMILTLTGYTLAAPKQQATIALSDFEFMPNSVTLQVGVLTELVLRNTGKVTHDLTLYPAPKATVADWNDYTMSNTYFQKMGEVEVDFAGQGHASSTSLFEVLVLPGQQAVIRFTPRTPGTFEMGCHVPGHYEAGMHGTITFK